MGRDCDIVVSLYNFSEIANSKHMELHVDALLKKLRKGRRGKSQVSLKTFMNCPLAKNEFLERKTDKNAL